MKKVTTYLGILCLLISTSLLAQDEFITTWTTTAASPTITLPANGTGYNYDVDWENDGIFDVFGVTTTITHDYGGAGTHTIVISGDFPKIDFTLSGDNYKLISVDQWGTQQWTTMYRAFQNCSNFNINATDVPDLSLVTDMSYMFNYATSFNQDINAWDVSSVTNMSFMFGAANNFNQPLANWNVSQVTNMSYMFLGTPFNQPINNWNTGNVTDMSYMFIASYFNQPIDNWDVGSVTNMRFMFASTLSFNQPIGNWNVSNVTNMERMFSTSEEFNQNISAWDVSNVTNMNNMFDQTKKFNMPIGNWNVGRVTSMSRMFNSAKAFNQTINNWDVSKVTDMNYMFTNNGVFNQPIGNWNVGNVVKMKSMFENSTVFNQDIGNWNVSNVTDMSYMFYGATDFNQDLGNWNVSNVSNMLWVFNGVTFSTNNYDSILTNWSQLSLQNNVNFHGGNSTYCNSEIDRQSIIDNFGWTINDSGLDCSGLSTSDFEKLNIKLFPNPITSSFTISGIENNIYNVQLLNLQGQIVKDITKYNLEPISTNSLTNGVYFVKIETNDASKTLKVLKVN